MPCTARKSASAFLEEGQESPIHPIAKVADNLRGAPYPPILLSGASSAAVRFVAAIASTILFCASLGHAAPPRGKSPLRSAAPCQVVVVGYTGGLETATTSASGIVWIRDRLRSLNLPDLCVHTFSAYNWTHGYRWVRSEFGAENDAGLTQDVIRHGPKVVIYGHSFGGWATVSLARRLGRAGIPIEMTVQMDSIGITDRTLPLNVRESANFYERNTPILYARGTIRAQDPSRTRILDNFQLSHGNHYTVSRDPQISDLIVGKVLELYESPQ